MIVSPSPFFGRNSVYRGPVNYLAVRRRVENVGSVYETSMQYRISGDGKRYYPRNVQGDIATFRRSDSGGGGALFVERLRKIGSKLYMCARVVDSGNNISANTRALLFSSDDGEFWDLIPTGIEGEMGGARYMVDIAGNATYIVALASTGHRSVSIDGGETFSPYGAIGFTGNNPALSLAASDAGFAAGGINGQLRTSSDPTSVWTARDLQFGSAPVQNIVAGNVFVASGANKIASCPLNNLSVWTARNSPVAGANDLSGFLSYGNGKWFAGGGVNIWCTSSDGLTWHVPTETPFTQNFVVYEALFDGEKWSVIGSGKVAFGNGVDPWQVEASPRLPENYPIRAVYAALFS